MQTIYIDILLVQSLYVNYFLLRAAARLTHFPLHRGRCVFAAGIGSFFSLLIFLPPMPVLVQILCRLLAAAVMVSLSFGIKKAQICLWLRQAACFFCCSFLLAGLLLAVTAQTAQGFTVWKNSCWYIDFSLLHLIVFTALAYAGLHLYEWIKSRGRHTDASYQVQVRLGNRTAVLAGLSDTGNKLTDAFSGAPVIVCSAACLRPVLDGFSLMSLPGYRLAPCQTVLSDGMMPLFRPDEVCIRRQTRHGMQTHSVDAMIGISGTQKCAVFHPRLIR